MCRIRIRGLMLLVALVALAMGTADVTESTSGPIRVRGLAWGPLHLQWARYEDPGGHVVGIAWWPGPRGGE